MQKKLSARLVKTVKQPGKYYDGNHSGLFLLVKSTGRKSYVQRIMVRRKTHDIGLGSTRLTALAEAREAAYLNQKIARSGGDPLALRKRQHAPTFAEAVETVIGIHAINWKGRGKSENQWRASLRDYAMKRLGDQHVSDITTTDVMAVLLPIWNEKRETAKRVRQRIGAVMKWAIAEGHRQDNPAGEAIGAALPKNGMARQHQRAVPHERVAAALQKVRASDAWASTKLAIEFLTLVACRSGEVRGARWNEVDPEAATWTVPAERIKSGRSHMVPLSDQSLAVLSKAQTVRDSSGLVFPSITGKQLSDNTLSKLFRELGINGTPHGMRTAFRSWCAETGQNREASEECLAHVNPNKLEAAYQRSSLLKLRCPIMQAWADYVSTQ